MQRTMSSIDSKGPQDVIVAEHPPMVAAEDPVDDREYFLYPAKGAPASRAPRLPHPSARVKPF